MTKNTLFYTVYQLFLSEKTKEKSERITLYIGIAGFFIHLILIFLVELGAFGANYQSKLLNSPIAAIYTPFSFILVYEVYLLIYYLPKSITIYIGKQYEIITLIVIRRLFKDLSNLELTANWFTSKDDLQFTYDMSASIVLFYLIYWFYRLSPKENTRPKTEHTLPSVTNQFVTLKKILATIAVPILIALAGHNFWYWLNETVYTSELSLKNINNIFFEQFFTLLILFDVMLLLFSFFYTDEFHKVMRNSGFIISTILLRLSFSADGIVNTILILTAVVFGILILYVHNQFEEKLKEAKK
jgi:hypothetical protein